MGYWKNKKMIVHRKSQSSFWGLLNYSGNQMELELVSTVKVNEVILN
jgi:hypothetical protein